MLYVWYRSYICELEVIDSNDNANDKPHLNTFNLSSLYLQPKVNYYT